MTIGGARVVASAIVCTVAAVTAPALASTSLQTNATPRQAEVGEGIRVELSAMTDEDGSPSSPHLDVPPGITVEGPSIASSQSFSFTNGSFVHRHGITATWVVSGTRAGHFTIGPATIHVGQSVLRGQTVEIDVVPPGTAAPRQRQRPRGGFFDPFDPMSGFPKLPGFDDDEEPDPWKQLTVPDTTPPEYAMPSAPDPVAFVRAVIEPQQAVVGQEMRLRVYGYGARGAWEEASSSEPTRPDFLSQTIVDLSARQQPVFVDIGNVRFIAKKARDIALFPLKAGSLVVGPMTLGFRGRGYPETRPGAGLIRTSSPITVQVSEPPVAGRPPGYQLGDVGDYTLTAEVDPRRVDAGGAVSVTVRLEGTGNVPRHVKVPEATGVDWPDPTTSESITPTDRGVAGWRQFRFVVTLNQSGTKNLGEITLPYWSPTAGRYQVARAALGNVEVLPGAAPVAPPPAPSAVPPKEAHDDLADLAPRRSLSSIAPESEPLTERRSLWMLLLLGPCLVVVSRALLSLSSRIRGRLAERASSKGALSQKALEEARLAATKTEPAAVAAAVERAVYWTIEDRLGIKARAVLRGELLHALEGAGGSKEVAEATVALLSDCERLRFGGASTEDLTRVASKAARVVGQIARARGNRRGDLAA